MALSEKKHHTSKGRAKQVPRETTSQLELFQLYEEEPGGSRPPCLGEPRGPQERVQRHTVEQMANFAPRGADSRRSCAADGGPAGEDPPERRRPAGDRSAQDHPSRIHPTARRTSCRSGWSSGWRCPCQRRPLWHWSGTHLARRGSNASGHERSTGGSMARFRPVGPHWKESPPAQGGKRILGAVPVPQTQSQIVDKAVDALVTMHKKFQQSAPIDCGCASPSVHRQSVGHSSYATETGTHSAQLCRRPEIPKRSSWVWG